MLAGLVALLRVDWAQILTRRRMSPKRNPNMSDTTRDGPVLICFDGSNDAANAITEAAHLLGSRPAVVVTVREPLQALGPR